MKTRELGTFFGVIFTVLLVVIAPRVDGEGSLIPNLSPTRGPNDIGIIFSTNDLLLGLQSYQGGLGHQGGLGAKIGWGKVEIRGLLNLTANGSAKVFGVDLEATGEYHLFPGPISPYVGASVGGGYVAQSDVSAVVSFTLGALAGVEVFVLDFLSVFAEYSLSANFANTTDLQTSASSFDYLISTGTGNNAKLGVVIYLMRSETKSR